MPKILITTSNFDCNLPQVEALRKSGYEIILNPHKRRLTEDEAAILFTSDIAGVIAGVEPLTRRVLQGAKNLKVISRCGTGMDNVDLDAAREHNIVVLNTPDAPAQAVAELAVGLMLNVLRAISTQDRAVRAGKWDRPMGRLLGEQAVGLVGFGRIGRLVAKQVSAFGAKVIAHDPFLDKWNTEAVALDELLARADIVSLHAPYNKDNHCLVDADFLRKMKKDSILINTARGELVDEDALLTALKSGHLAGAGLDVYNAEPYTGPLKDLENIVLTAHTGSYARETRQRQEAEAAENLLNALSKK